MSVNLLNRRPLDKYCPRCEKFLGKESFHKDQATEDGKTFYCKGCRQKLRSFVCLKGKQTKEPIFICDSTALIKREDIFKPCSKCHRILLLKEFPFACNCNHRRRPECRNCSNSYHKKWISDKKEEKKPNIRISLLVDLGGKFCRRCWEFLSLEDFPLCKKGKLRRSCWCKECKKNADRIYYGNNTGECITRSTAYGIKRYHTNIQAKMRAILRSRLHGVLKGGAKRGSAVRDLGCTINELSFYIESRFLPGMTWKNWSYRGWHLDHVIPLSRFDLTDREQCLQAFHYTNLQPLWAKDNMAKGNR